MDKKIWGRPFSDDYEPEVISCDLNSDARELLSRLILSSFDLVYMEYIYQVKLLIPQRFFKRGKTRDFKTNFNNLMLKEDKKIVFEYIIHLLNEKKITRNGYSAGLRDLKGSKKIMREINDILRQCGVSYEFIYDRDKEKFRLKEIGSEMQEEASKEALTKMKKLGWEKELAFFEKAHKEYQDNNAPKCFQNCYLALEKTLKRIVGEIDTSKNVSKMTTGSLLDILKERGYFPPILGEYHKNVFESIEKANAYIAGERKKSRHKGEIEKEFLVLTLHQTAATLNFLIDRHTKLKTKV